MRTFTAVAGTLTSTVAMLAGAIAISPAAHAATHEVAVTCDVDLGDLVIYGEIGDTFIFSMDPTCTDDREDWQDWTLNNSLIFNFDEDLAKPGMLEFVSVDGEAAVNDGDSAWWVESDGSGSTVITTRLLSASLVNETYVEAVPLTLDGKVAQFDNNFVDESTYLPAAGFKSRIIIWGGASGGNSSGGRGNSSSTVSIPRFTLSSSASDRGTCWPTVSGVGGSWVQVTASGCTPPTGRAGATLLGWATSPAFPVARATDGVAVDDEIAGVRMIFIPVDGYTFLSGDNTLYPIWSS